MARRKFKLEWIVNDAARKASYRKRKASILKKVMELTILCGIDAMAIIYHPENNEPEVWPSPTKAEELLKMYGTKSQRERAKKKVTQESYLKYRKAKVEEENRKQQKENLEMDFNFFMNQIYNGKGGMNELETVHLHRLIWLLDGKINDIRKRAEYIQQLPRLLLSIPTSLGASCSEPLPNIRGGAAAGPHRWS